jgi:uncharacterized protein (TIGR02246 family)
MTEPGAVSAVRDLYLQLLEAWNNRDAALYSSLFAADGTAIGFDGSQMTGAQIRMQLTPIFTDHPTATYVAKIRELRELAPGAAVLRAIAGMVPPGRRELNPSLNAVQTMVAQMQDEQWRIVLFQNTPAQFHGRLELVEKQRLELQSVLLSGGTVR